MFSSGPVWISTFFSKGSNTCVTSLHDTATSCCPSPKVWRCWCPVSAVSGVWREDNPVRHSPPVLWPHQNSARHLWIVKKIKNKKIRQDAVVGGGTSVLSVHTEIIRRQQLRRFDPSLLVQSLLLQEVSLAGIHDNWKHTSTHRKCQLMCVKSQSVGVSSKSTHSHLSFTLIQLLEN